MFYLTKHQTQADYEAAESSLATPHVSLTQDNMQVHYKPYVPPHDYSQNYFTMVVTVGGDIKWSGSTTANTLSYSKDNGDSWSAVTSADTISVAAGDKVLWKGTTTPQSYNGIGMFSGVQLYDYSRYWSSTEYAERNAWFVYARNGSVDNYDKSNLSYVRAFLAL